MKMILFAFFASSVGTLLVPLTSENYYLLLACRFLTGIGQANYWPGMWNWWSYW